MKGLVAKWDAMLSIHTSVAPTQQMAKCHSVGRTTVDLLMQHANKRLLWHTKSTFYGVSCLNHRLEWPPPLLIIILSSSIMLSTRTDIIIVINIDLYVSVDVAIYTRMHIYFHAMERDWATRNFSNGGMKNEHSIRTLFDFLLYEENRCHAGLLDGWRHQRSSLRRATCIIDIDNRFVKTKVTIINSWA